MRVLIRMLVMMMFIVILAGGAVQAAVSPTPKKVPVLKPSSAPKATVTPKPKSEPVYSADLKATTQKSVVSVKVSPTTATLLEGKSVKLTATVTVKGGATKAVKWTSSSSVVKVVNGLVTAGKLPKGKTSLTVKIKATSSWSPTISGTCTIKVVPNITVQRVVVKPTTLKLKVRQKAKLSYTVYPANASNKAVEWASAAKAIASVDASGRVTANKVGTTTVVVVSKDGSKTGTCKVIVTR